MDPRPPGILIVDDDAAVRHMLTDLLRGEGYLVASAPDGAAALTTLQATPGHFQLILLDLMMPLVDGYVFRQKQLADPDLCRIPVVALSASAGVRYRGLPEGIGPERFLAKPADAGAIVAIAALYCGPARV
jgi:CheY-like chemotaxis protein